VGFDNPAPLHEYAARLALPLWVDFMKAALQNKPEHLIAPPKNVVSVQINAKTGLREKNEKNSIMEYFRQQEIPEADETPEFNPHDRNQHDDLF
jgi:penicillin-binding protein 1A